MRVIILGCGPSTGIPLITGEWGQCNPHNPRNRRRRSSVLLQKNGKNILIDAGPDVREQLLDAEITHLDAVILTHAHADHIRGLDDLKCFARSQQQLIPVYGDQKTRASLEAGYSYALFQKDKLYSPFLTFYELSESSLKIEGIDVIPFPQIHGGVTSWGIRVDNFAYSTDFNELSETALDCLQGLKCWIIDCLRFAEHPSHSCFSNTMKLLRKIKPIEAILTHMNQDIDYDKIIEILPAGIRPAYDGMIVDFCGENISIYDKFIK